MYAQSTSSTVIDPIQHKGLIADKERICAKACIQTRFLYEGMIAYCSPREIEWVRRFPEFREKRVPGLMIEAKASPEVSCQAICAALLRNFINAQVMSVESVLHQHKSGYDVTSTTVVLIPNMFITACGKPMPPFKIHSLYDVLLMRSLRGKPTVVCVEDSSKLMGMYGKTFANFLQGFFKA
jgi:hypothetical protein